MPQLSKRGLGRVLAVVFLVALIMGPGPGALLIRAVPGRPPAVILGLPVLYLWTVFWAAVMAMVVVLASRLLWSTGERKDS